MNSTKKEKKEQVTPPDRICFICNDDKEKVILPIDNRVIGTLNKEILIEIPSTTKFYKTKKIELMSLKDAIEWLKI